MPRPSWFSPTAPARRPRRCRSVAAGRCGPRAPCDERIVTPAPLSEQGTLAPGLYVLQAYPDGGLSEMDQAVVVSNIQLTMKAGLHSGMAWAIDIRTGEPVADLPITLWRTDEPLSISATRAPMARRHLPGTRRSDLLRTRCDLGRSPAHGRGLVGLEQRPRSLGVQRRTTLRRIRCWSLTSPPTGPLYRPNDTAEIKGIVRARSDARYTVPELGSVFVNVYGPMGEVVVSDTASFRITARSPRPRRSPMAPTSACTTSSCVASARRKTTRRSARPTSTWPSTASRSSTSQSRPTRPTSWSTTRSRPRSTRASSSTCPSRARW